MAFHEVRFPEDISKGSSGGPERRTDIVTLRSGFEQRNTIWADSRRSYDASLGIRDIDELYDVIEFFEGRMGMLHGFRWKDWADYKSGAPGTATTAFDVQIGVGTGAQTTFQLRKNYVSGLQTYSRVINKPVAGTVKIARNGTEIFTGWTVDTTTGIVTFSVAPTAGHAIQAGFEFDVPVRFNMDKMTINMEAFEAGSAPAVDIIEIRV